MDRYAKTLLTKVGHIFILYQPLEEKFFVSCTQAKIWVLEICPKIASHATFFTFLFISQEGDHLGKIYLITSNQHGCRNLGQNQLENFWLLARRQFLLQAWYALLKVDFTQYFCLELLIWIMKKVPILKIGDKTCSIGNFLPQVVSTYSLCAILNEWDHYRLIVFQLMSGWLLLQVFTLLLDHDEDQLDHYGLFG